jgi:hypothetical protein
MHRRREAVASKRRAVRRTTHSARATANSPHGSSTVPWVVYRTLPAYACSIVYSCDVLASGSFLGNCDMGVGEQQQLPQEMDKRRGTFEEEGHARGRTDRQMQS